MICRACVLLACAALLAGTVRAEEDELRTPPASVLVLGPTGRPLAGAFLLEAKRVSEGVRILAVEDPVVAQSDRRGRIDPLPGGIGTRDPLVVWAPGLAAAVLPAGPLPVAVRLLPAEVTTGRVRLPRGRAAVRREIIALPSGGAGEIGHRTLTDVHGAFEFGALHAGRWRLFVRRVSGRLQSLGPVQAGSEVGERTIRSRTSITGRLLDGDGTHGQPVAGVAIRFLPLTLDRRPARAEPLDTRTGADGVFVADGFDPGIYRAVLLDPRWTFDHRPPSVQAELGRAREITPWFAHRRTDVIGTVVDVGAKPIVGVEIRLVPDPVRTPPPGGYAPLPKPTHSDTAGRFRIRGVVPADGYRLLATAVGYSPWTSNPFRVDRRRDTTLKTFALREGWRLRVTVRDGRAHPVAAASVRVVPASNPSALDDPIWKTVVRGDKTDAAGWVEIADLPADDVLCLVEAPGRVPRRIRVSYPRVSDHRKIEVDLEPAPSLAGTIVSPVDGGPAGPFTVRAFTRDGHEVRETETDERGAFRLAGLRETATDVEVYRSDSVRTLPLATVENVVPGAEPHLEIPVPQLHALRGMATELDPGGPRPDVTVTCLRYDRRREAYTWQRVAGVSPPAGQIDERFEILGLPPGTYTVRLQQGRNDGGPVRIRVGDEDVEGIELRLPAGARVAGTVLDAESAPLLGVAVRLVRMHGEDPAHPEWIHAPTCHTNDRGEYFFDDVAPGLWRIEAEREEAAPDQVTVRLLDGETRVVRDLLLAEGGAIQGSVEGGDGEPLDGVLVVARRFDAQGRDLVARTGARGRYLLRHVSPGPYRVRVGARTSGSTPYVEAIAEVLDSGSVQVDFTAREDAELEGTVLRGGRPVAGALVELVHEADSSEVPLRRYRTSTDAGGRFVVEHLPGGPYRIHLQSGAWKTARALFLEPGERRRLDLESWEGRLRGTVVTRGGRPVGGAHVVVRPLDEAGDEAVEVDASFFGEGRTDPRGGFTLRGLPVGAYRLSVSALGLPPGHLPRVEAELPGADFHVEVVLGRGGDLALTVQDENGRGVTGASLWIEDLSGMALHRHPYTTGAAGRIRIEGLPAGTMQVRVRARGLGRPPLGSIRIKEGEETHLTLRLRPAGSLRLVVTGEGSDPIARTRVDLIRPSTGEVLARRRPLSPIRLASPWGHVPRTGVVVIPDLEEGSYVAVVSAGRTYEESRIPVSVASGGENTVRVVLVPAGR